MAKEQEHEIAETINNKLSWLVELFNLDLQSIVEQATLKEGSLIENLTKGIATPISNGLSYILTFIVVFVLLILGLSIIGYVLDVVSKLPILNFFNSTAGMLIGMLEGFLVCWFAVNFAVWIGAFFASDVLGIIKESYLAKFFYGVDIGKILNSFSIVTTLYK